ncbi:hypothetical protein [Glacieibacterium frigidum]|uniref:Uncharacterized protein n=1 Tax=Glacieibacterium frigidum TaxID=2593303 RepID=A0A552UGN5_9SPHN|nr:hypothetical protein [Glacieibacterium frigidum]TRW17375.1 hypothetical protein FMM06_04160 [Glacieibacterium frigidum]
MSRDDIKRAQRLVQLRDLALEAAMRRLAEATAAAADAAAAEAAALKVRDDGIAALAHSRATLVDDPRDAPTGLARIALADQRLVAARERLAEAAGIRAATDAEVIEARAAARRAQARRDAMSDRANRLKRAHATAQEERAAIEAEEGAAAMRKAA